MKESAEYLLNKIPNVYVVSIDKEAKILRLSDKHTTGHIWDTKVRYWAFNLEINHGYTLKYV